MPPWGAAAGIVRISEVSCVTRLAREPSESLDVAFRCRCMHPALDATRLGPTNPSGYGSVPAQEGEQQTVSLLHRKRLGRLSRNRLRQSTVLRCPFNGHQVSWCRHLCEPVGGVGACGRPATHGMKGKTQIAIARYKAREAAAEAATPTS